MPNSLQLIGATLLIAGVALTVQPEPVAAQLPYGCCVQACPPVPGSSLASSYCFSNDLGTDATTASSLCNAERAARGCGGWWHATSGAPVTCTPGETYVIQGCEGATLPVELSSFNTIVSGDKVALTWSTASETDNAGFDVEQEIGSDVFEAIGYVEGHGTTVEPQEYSFEVNSLDPGSYRFRLKQIDFDGAFEYSSIVEAAVSVPDRFLIEPAYPNPFNPSTTLRFAVAAEQHVEVTLINAAGQSIRTLYSGTVAANEMQQLVVDASTLPSGTYMVHFEGNGLSAMERIVLSK